MTDKMLGSYVIHVSRNFIDGLQFFCCQNPDCLYELADMEYRVEQLPGNISNRGSIRCLRCGAERPIIAVDADGYQWRIEQDGVSASGWHPAG